jgi:hypothetical protein
VKFLTFSVPFPPGTDAPAPGTATGRAGATPASDCACSRHGVVACVTPAGTAASAGVCSHKIAEGRGSEVPCVPGTPTDAEASTEAPAPSVCSQFVAAPGGAWPWCDTCGWRLDKHDPDHPIARRWAERGRLL